MTDRWHHNSSSNNPPIAGFSTPIAVGFFSVFRIYEPWECGKDGYPLAWHSLEWREGGIKDMVREQAGHRCIRCGHPYRPETALMEEVATEQAFADKTIAPELPGSVEEIPEHFVMAAKQYVNWSPCDGRCCHGGVVRYREKDGTLRELEVEQVALDVGVLVKGDGGFEASEVQAAWRILTVHHLNERKHDCRWHNLVALCQRCHLTIQRKVEMNQVWPFEHSEWFRPYAAAFYAYSYLGEELTPDETIARLGELLALERIA